ncbi:MAG: glycosyltransferase [Mariprofundaceae bacterium]|nr:glycosyltransferase [Mariprofundaceae bacterium]
MSDAPLVSIIMPTYNQAHFIHEALQSVIQQTYENWEVIVINNYSSDNTVDVVRSFGDMRIRLVDFRNNGVIAASRNRGIELASGTYLAFLDSDDVWFPEKLDVCVEALEKGYDLVAHGFQVFGEGRKKNKCMDHEHIPTFSGLLYSGNCIATSTVVVRRREVLDAHQFVEDGEMITAEDYHLWLKLSCNGARMIVLPRTLSGYRIHAGNSSSYALKNMLAVRKVIEGFFPAHESRSLSERIRILGRYGLLNYDAGRNMQANALLWGALPFFMKTVAFKPAYLRAYLMILLSLLRIYKE